MWKSRVCARLPASFDSVTCCGNQKTGQRFIRIAALSMLLALFCSAATAGFVEGARAEARGDYEGARREYLRAAQDGNVDAQNNLGRLYRQGKGGSVDLKQALHWVSKAADAGQ